MAIDVTKLSISYEGFWTSVEIFVWAVPFEFSKDGVPFEGCGLLNDPVCTVQYSVSWRGIMDESRCVKHVGGRGQGLILGITPIFVLSLRAITKTFQNNICPD